MSTDRGEGMHVRNRESNMFRREDPSRNMYDCVAIEMIIVTCSKSIIIKILIAVRIDFPLCSELSVLQ